MQSNISFTAKFISTATVRKFANNGNYIPAEANVVELYTKNKNDLKTLQEIKELWRKPNYAGAICEDAFSAQRRRIGLKNYSLRMYWDLQKLVLLLEQLNL